MPQFRKLIDMPAVVLYREDIRQLGHLMIEGLSVRPRAFEFSLTAGDATYTADSVDELLSQDLPTVIDYLSFSAMGWTDGNAIDRMVTVNLRPTGGSYQIHASDEVWFRGKIQQVSEFASRRSPWYGNFRSRIPFLIGVLQGLTYLSLPYLLMQRQWLFSAVAAITLVVLARVFSAYLNGRLFPFARLQLSAPKRWLDGDKIMLIFTVVGAIATLVGVIIQLVQALSQ